MRKIDFEFIKLQITLSDVLAFLGWRGTPEKNELRGPCPLHEEDGDRRCFVVKKGEWHCHKRGCGKGGDQIQLWALKQGLGYARGAVSLCKRCGFRVPHL
jgi:DNA primase